MEGDTKRPTSAMQLSSSDEVFLAPGRNDVLERRSPVPRISSTSTSAGSRSSYDASDGGAQQDSATSLNSPTLEPPVK